MIEIDSDKTIYINRGDEYTLTLTANKGSYQFEPNDVIQFRVYDKNGYTEKPVLEKIVKVLELTNKVDIVLEEQDTAFVPQTNKPITYWYDVSFNETETIIGYDDDKVKKFIVRPAKKGDDDIE